MVYGLFASVVKLVDDFLHFRTHCVKVASTHTYPLANLRQQLGSVNRLRSQTSTQWNSVYPCRNQLSFANSALYYRCPTLVNQNSMQLNESKTSIINITRSSNITFAAPVSKGDAVTGHDMPFLNSTDNFNLIRVTSREVVHIAITDGVLVTIWFLD